MKKHRYIVDLYVQYVRISHSLNSYAKQITPSCILLIHDCRIVSLLVPLAVQLAGLPKERWGVHFGERSIFGPGLSG